jgi:hypothetical protein
VRDLAQELERVRLRLDRVGVRILHPADHFHSGGLHLERLPLGRRGHDGAGGLDRAAGGQPQDLVGVVGQRVRGDDLDRVEAGAIGDVHEGDARLRVASRADPALDGDGSVLRCAAREDVGAGERKHAALLPWKSRWANRTDCARSWRERAEMGYLRGERALLAC